MRAQRALYRLPEAVVVDQILAVDLDGVVAHHLRVVVAHRADRERLDLDQRLEARHCPISVSYQGVDLQFDLAVLDEVGEAVRAGLRCSPDPLVPAHQAAPGPPQVTHLLEPPLPLGVLGVTGSPDPLQLRGGGRDRVGRRSLRNLVVHVPGARGVLDQFGDVDLVGLPALPGVLDAPSDHVTLDITEEVDSGLPCVREPLETALGSLLTASSGRLPHPDPHLPCWRSAQAAEHSPATRPRLSNDPSVGCGGSTCVAGRSYRRRHP